MLFLSFAICILLLGICDIHEASPFTKLGRPALRYNSFQSIKDYKLISAQNGNDVSLQDVISPKMITSKGSTARGSLVIFLTHLADLSSFETAQQLNYYLPQFQNEQVRVTTIAPGATREHAQLFCELTKLPIDTLYLDSTASLYREHLPFSKGFLPNQSSLSPYLKLLPMLMGIGSEGTIQEVLRGYFGDKTAPAAWIRESLRLVDTSNFNVLGEKYQRPFELATMRLQNMQDVLTHWQRLVPQDTTLLTQLGGAYVFSESGTVLYEHIDTGILTYVSLRQAATALDITLVD